MREGGKAVCDDGKVIRGTTRLKNSDISELQLCEASVLVFRPMLLTQKGDAFPC